MNVWNYSFVQSLYPSLSLGFVTTIGNETTLNIPSMAHAIRQPVAEEKVDPCSEETIARARALSKTPGFMKRFPSSFYNVLAIGYVCKWLSELGKTEKLGGLRTVDARLNPSWEE
jgi:Linalool dehydratase/isomerase